MNVMKTNLMHSKDVPLCQIVIGNDEIEEIKEYLNFGQMGHLCQYIDAEISKIIRSEWKGFNTIKEVLKAGKEPTCHFLK